LNASRVWITCSGEVGIDIDASTLSDVLVTVGIAVIEYNSDDTPGSMGNQLGDAALRAQVDDPSVCHDFGPPHGYAWMNPYWSQPMYAPSLEAKKKVFRAPEPRRPRANPW
jgi:hypothetical protein